MSIIDRKSLSLNAEDPDRDYGELLDVIVDYLPTDFRIRWMRQ